MKKRCTNPSCRREFRVEMFTTACPHCGKKYPRAKCLNDGQNGTMAVVLIRSTVNRLATIMVIRASSGIDLETNRGRLGLKDSKEILDNAPSLVGYNLSKEQARELVRQYRDVRAEVVAIPEHNWKKEGVFVSPKIWLLRGSRN